HQVERGAGLREIGGESGGGGVEAVGGGVDREILPRRHQVRHVEPGIERVVERERAGRGAEVGDKGGAERTRERQIAAEGAAPELARRNAAEGQAVVEIDRRPARPHALAGRAEVERRARSDLLCSRRPRHRYFVPQTCSRFRPATGKQNRAFAGFKSHFKDGDHPEKRASRNLKHLRLSNRRFRWKPAESLSLRTSDAGTS